jgi:hypothetical protein
VNRTEISITRIILDWEPRHTENPSSTLQKD